MHISFVIRMGSLVLVLCQIHMYINMYMIVFIYVYVYIFFVLMHSLKVYKGVERRTYGYMDTWTYIYIYV